MGRYRAHFDEPIGNPVDENPFKKGRPILGDPGIIAAGVGAAGSLLGSSKSSRAASSAAAAQEQAAAASIAEQRRQFDLNRADQSGFIATGNAANARLADLLGLSVKNPATSVGLTAAQSSYDTALKNYNDAVNANSSITSRATRSYPAGSQPGYQGAEYWNDYFSVRGERAPVDLTGLKASLDSSITALEAAKNAPAYSPSADFGSLTKDFDANDLANDPVYNSGLQFGLNEGTRAINSRAQASGSADSGSVLKALTQYANDYGSTKANDAYNRFNTNKTIRYNQLAGVSGAGQNATNNVAATNTGISNNISNLIQDQGNSRSAGIVGSANAFSSGLSGVSDAFNAYRSNNTLSEILRQRSGSLNPNFSDLTNPNVSRYL